MNRYQKDVAAAVVALDEEVLDWRDKVSAGPGELRLDDSCECILGQIYDDYSFAPHSMRSLPGFCGDLVLYKDQDTWDAYHAAWVEELSSD